MTKYWLSIFCLFIPLAVQAKDDANDDLEVPSPWKVQVEFGFRKLTGNTESESINTALHGEYTRGRYRTNADYEFYRLEKYGVETKRRSTYGLQNDIKFGPKVYFYTSYKGLDTEYTAYYKDHTVSAGLGYQFIFTDKFTLEGELGPGYRYQKPNLDEIGSRDIVFDAKVEEPIVRGSIKSHWKILDNLSFDGDVTTISGNSNTLVTTDLGVTTNVTEGIAIKVNYNRQYHSRVPTGLSKKDSITEFNIMFSF
ncbi:DUF481 domain-containing protein [Vibrio sp.]|uniref:DUF481 domain-containing protein n=1 Tax=Vibrio viridaestus TaxID=2487322 RepID=A0A3N9TC63_9VIBR|nr:DUF481 domain-containing protein [Vibrio viridaestus]MDC0612368.1 DUF481 domain-containing protein [Vibrio sp.]RQW61065.1 DUF481 domain-containing protein [Vibrio viridaestus]